MIKSYTKQLYYISYSKSISITLLYYAYFKNILYSFIYMCVQKKKSQKSRSPGAGIKVWSFGTMFSPLNHWTISLTPILFKIIYYFACIYEGVPVVVFMRLGDNFVESFFSCISVGSQDWTRSLDFYYKDFRCFTILPAPISLLLYLIFTSWLTLAAECIYL